MSTIRTDTLWQPLPVCDDARLRHWLLDRGSLTRRVQTRCNDFRLQLLSQRIARIDRDERMVIGVFRGVKCLVREVTLNCGAQPVVFAHSGVDPRALRGPWHMLMMLGARPLGAALFADPRVARRPLRFRRLGGGHELYQRACALMRRPPQYLWARRSLFVMRGSCLLVTEVFLPAILTLSP